MDDVINSAILNVLQRETVLHANSLATVTENCLVVRDHLHKAQAVIGISSIRMMEKVTTTNPSLLVIAAGLFIIAAACHASHESAEISGAVALIGLFFIFGYYSGRRASVRFTMDDQIIESKRGTYTEATSIIAAVRGLSKNTCN